jgi:ferrochelatase
MGAMVRDIGKTGAIGFDAVLFVSFGGPEAPEDVIPFLENVTRGRGIPRERLAVVGEHYYGFGGRSPINDQNRALIAAIEKDFADAGLDLPVYWGNRNWDPYLTDTMAAMTRAGVRTAAVFITSAYSSYSGCRQYRENLADALRAAGPDAPRLVKVRHYFNHPGFITPMVARTRTALAELPVSAREGARIVFVTHSIPIAMNETSGPTGGAYVAQHRAVAAAVAAGVNAGVGARTGRDHGWDLAYCSRSGPPTQPWLEPDVNDHLQALHAGGVPGVVIVPIGFISDHMEVAFDLDVEALATAARIGLPATRAGTVGTAPEFVAAVRELVLERAAAEAGLDPPRPQLGALGPSHDLCPVGCCPNLRGERPAACGADGVR